MSKVSGGDSKSTLYCSFCGKSQHEVRKLIAGPTVFICDECVELCMDIIREENKSAVAKSRAGVPTPSEIKSVLDGAIATEAGARHPGLLHMYIHLVEMSTAPEQGLVAADRLRDIVPDGGHLHHMPTHLDVLCGDYRRVVSSNSAAILADERFLHRNGPMNFYTLYRSHDYHFKIYGAMFLAQRAVALETVAQMEVSIPEDLLRVQTPPMADWLEGFLGMRVHVYIRFGMWQELIDMELPRDPDLYSATTAMIHYGRGVAHSATGNRYGFINSRHGRPAQNPRAARHDQDREPGTLGAQDVPGPCCGHAQYRSVPLPRQRRVDQCHLEPGR